MHAPTFADATFDLLRFYLQTYDQQKVKRSYEAKAKKDQKQTSKLFIPPVAPCRLRKVRGYRLCWSVGAVELFRSGSGSKNSVSSNFLKSLALSEQWEAAFAALRRYQSRNIVMGPNTTFRVTVLGFPRSSVEFPCMPENLTSQFIATWLGEGIRKQFGWTVNLVNYDVEVVATVNKNETASRIVGVLSLGVTMCRATSSECLAGLLASQNKSKCFDKKVPQHSGILTKKDPETLLATSGCFIVRQMLSIMSELNECRASWCLVRRAIKSDYFRRKLLNRANGHGETPLILAAKACETRLVSLILALTKRKIRETKLPLADGVAPEPQPVRVVSVPFGSDLLKRDHKKYDAVMHSCDKGDNSTLAVLLNHKTGAFNWGFNRLCERSLAVAASTCQHHTLNLLFHHLLTNKRSLVQPSLFWPALQSALGHGNSLTVALILDFMRQVIEKRVQTEKIQTDSPDLSIPMSEEVLKTLFGAPCESISKSLALTSTGTGTGDFWSFPRFPSVLNLLLKAGVTVKTEHQMTPLDLFLKTRKKEKEKQEYYLGARPLGLVTATPEEVTEISYRQSFWNYSYSSLSKSLAKKSRREKEEEREQEKKKNNNNHNCVGLRMIINEIIEKKKKR